MLWQPGGASLWGVYIPRSSMHATAGMEPTHHLVLIGALLPVTLENHFHLNFTRIRLGSHPSIHLVSIQLSRIHASMRLFIHLRLLRKMLGVFHPTWKVSKQSLDFDPNSSTFASRQLLCFLTTKCDLALRKPSNRSDLPFISLFSWLVTARWRQTSVDLLITARSRLFRVVKVRANAGHPKAIYPSSQLESTCTSTPGPISIQGFRIGFFPSSLLPTGS